jgi:SH3 domain-containing YSC84-like protein 1
MEGNGDMKRTAVLAFVLVAALTLGACTRQAPLSIQAETLIENARWTIETFKARSDKPMHLFAGMLAEAHGVVVLPGVYKAGFLLGAEGGNGVLVARRPSGEWGYPAFYTMGAGSFGLQAGGQVSEVVLIIRNPGAVSALIEHQGKLGADLEVTAGTVGAGMEGAVTTNLGADIVVFSDAVGLFGGASLEGSVLARRNDFNDVFYGPGATPETIVIEGRHANAKADALRNALVVR